MFVERTIANLPRDREDGDWNMSAKIPVQTMKSISVGVLLRTSADAVLRLYAESPKPKVSCHIM